MEAILFEFPIVPKKFPFQTLKANVRRLPKTQNVMSCVTQRPILEEECTLAEMAVGLEIWHVVKSPSSIFHFTF